MRERSYTCHNKSTTNDGSSSLGSNKSTYVLFLIRALPGIVFFHVVCRVEKRGVHGPGSKKLDRKHYCTVIKLEGKLNISNVKRLTQQ